MEDKREGNERIRKEPTTLWNLDFIIILIFGFMTGTANQMVNPLLSTYAVSLGATLPLAGTIVGLQSGIAMFLRPISGAASDLLNRKFVMVGSICVTALSFTGYLLFTNLTAVILCRLLQGFAYAFMNVARTAYATEFMPKDRIGEGIAFTSFGVVLSQAAGPSVGRFIADTFGYGGCFAVAMGCCVLGMLILSIRPYQHEQGKFNWNKMKLKNLVAVEIIPYGLIAGMFTVITQLASSFLYLLGDERSIGNIAIFFTVYSLSALVLRPLSGRMLDKFGLSTLLYPAFVFGALSLGLVGAAQGLFLIIIAGVCKALSQGVVPQCIQGASIKRIGRERAGVISATIHMVQDLLNLLAPVLGGVLAAGIGYGGMYYSFAGLLLLGIPFYRFLQHSEKKREEQKALEE